MENTKHPIYVSLIKFGAFKYVYCIKTEGEKAIVGKTIGVALTGLIRFFLNSGIIADGRPIYTDLDEGDVYVYDAFNDGERPKLNLIRTIDQYKEHPLMAKARRKALQLGPTNIDAFSYVGKRMSDGMWCGGIRVPDLFIERRFEYGIGLDADTIHDAEISNLAETMLATYGIELPSITTNLADKRTITTKLQEKLSGLDITREYSLFDIYDAGMCTERTAYEMNLTGLYADGTTHIKLDDYVDLPATWKGMDDFDGDGLKPLLLRKPYAMKIIRSIRK